MQALAAASGCRPLGFHFRYVAPGRGRKLEPDFDRDRQANDRKRRKKEGPPLPILSGDRSEEHTSELQSLRHLVCRLLLEKKKRCGPRAISSNSLKTSEWGHTPDTYT